MRSLTYSALIAASLALTANAAMAATTQVHKTAATTQVHKTVKPQVAHRRVATHVAARPAYPRGNYYGFDVGQFIQSLFGGPIPYAQYARGAVKTRGRDTGTYDWSFSSATDTSTPIDNSAEEAAQQAAEMANEAQSEATMQMDQELNDEANRETNAGIAAAEQTEINANN